MILHMVSGIFLSIFACVFTIMSAFETQDIRVKGTAALCWGLLLLVYCNYRNELKKEIYGDK